MIIRWVSGQTPKAQIRKIDSKVQKTKVGTMVIINARFIMSGMGITTTKTTSTGVTMLTEMKGVGPMFHLKIVKLLIGIVEVVLCELRI